MRRKTAAGHGNPSRSSGPSSVSRALRHALPAFLAVLLPTLPAGAQPVLRLGSWTGFAELRFDTQEQRTDFRLGRSSIFDRTLTEERVALRNTLTVGNRRFLIVNYGFTLGLLQSEVTADQGEARGDGDLRALDLTATFRPFSPRRLTFLYNRAENETPVEFAGTRVLDTESFGVHLAAAGPKWLPGELRLRQAKLRSTSELGESIRGLDQMRRTLDYSASNRWQRHDLFAAFRFEDVEDRIAPRFSHRSQTLDVSHRFEVLAPRLVTLSTVLRVFDRGGELTSSSFYLDEVLRMRHRKNLSSSIRWVSQSLDSFSGPASDSQRLFLGLHHTLYESLETDFLAGRTRTTSPGGRTELDEIGLDSAYEKKLPGDGRLKARLTVRYETRDSLRGDGQELVARERHTARFGVPSRLERPAVIAGTVVVTDELGSTIFEEGVDYELLLIGDFAEILPLEGGRIRDGQRILVEYRIEVPAASRSEALRNGLDVSVDYGWFAPFFGFRSVDNRLVEGLESRLFQDQQDRIVGVRFQKRGRRLQWVSFNELRIRDSDLQAFETLRFGESFTYRPARRWTVRLNLAHLATDFPELERENRIQEGRLRLRWTPRPLLSLEAFASLRTSEDTVAADQRFDRYGFESRWTLGKITLVASIERWRRTRGDDSAAPLETFEGSSASVRLSRRFFPGRLAAPRRPLKPEPWPDDLPGLWSRPPDEAPVTEAQDPAPEDSEAGHGGTI